MKSKPSVHFKILYYCAKIFGLAPFDLERENNTLKIGSFWQKLWPIIVSGIYIVGMSSLTVLRLQLEDGTDNALSETGDILAFQLGIFAVVASVATIWQKSNVIVGIVDSFVTIDGILNTFGIQQDYEKKFKLGARLFGLLSCLILLTEMQIELSFLYVTNYNITFLMITGMIGTSIIYSVYHFIIFFFLGIVVTSKERFEQLNKTLNSVFVERKNNRILSNAIVSAIELITEDDDAMLQQKLVKIQDIRDKLHDTIDKIMDVSSFPILSIIGFYFVTIVTGFFYMFSCLSTSFGKEAIMIVVSSVIWISMVLLQLFAIGAVCASAQNAGNSTAIVLRKIWIKERPIKSIAEIQMLSLQLLQRPLTISAFGFFSLDYSYLYKIFCAVVAYFVIMVQLDTSKTDSSSAYNNSSSSLLNATKI